MSEETIIKLYLISFVVFLLIQICKNIYDIMKITKELDKTDDNYEFFNK